MNLNGGYYFDGLVYFTSVVTESYEGAIYFIDPVTYKTKIVVNSYFGVRLNGLDEVTYGPLSSSSNSSKSVMFSKDTSFRYIISGYRLPYGMPSAIWRFDPEGKLLTPVISRADTLVPNWICVNKDSNLLYATDTTAIAKGRHLALGDGSNSAGSSAIYLYNLTAAGYLLTGSKQLVSFARRGIPDGLHIDDKWRIWTGEYVGTVVRSLEGKGLEIFNAEYFLAGNKGGLAEYKEAPFALTDNTLVLLALEKL